VLEVTVVIVLAVALVGTTVFVGVEVLFTVTVKGSVNENDVVGT